MKTKVGSHWTEHDPKPLPLNGYRIKNNVVYSPGTRIAMERYQAPRRLARMALWTCVAVTLASIVLAWLERRM